MSSVSADLAPSGRKGCAGACQQPLDIAFTMAFQPVVDIAARRIHAYEALVRGPDGAGAGSVLSQVTDQNRYVFDQACRVRAIEMAAKLGIDCRLNINFLPNEVYEPEACLQATLGAAARSGFPARNITFEFTEDEQIVDRRHLLDIVATYRRFGFQTALDDFGAGYAGLSLLADFQPDIVKLDRALIAGLDSDARRRTIVAGTVDTVRSLGLEVVAEGVERREELAILREIGITLVQGFLFARPTFEGIVRADELPWDEAL